MKYLGIDFGLKRVGLAISGGNLASPFKIIEVRNFKDAVEKVQQLIKAEKFDKIFDKIIVGLPQGKMGKNVLGFVKALKKAGLDVVTCDETLSTKRANSQMIETGFPLKKRRVNDAYAASIILQDWLDEQT